MAENFDERNMTNLLKFYVYSSTVQLLLIISVADKKDFYNTATMATYTYVHVKYLCTNKKLLL